MEEGPSSMYEFEGVDYAKEPSAADKKAFDDLLSSKIISPVLQGITIIITFLLKNITKPDFSY